jgi:hypothetical protein
MHNKIYVFSVFNHLNSKWQYIAQLYESGGMDEENTDTQVSIKTQYLLCEATHGSVHAPCPSF